MRESEREKESERSCSSKRESESTYVATRDRTCLLVYILSFSLYLPLEANCTRLDRNCNTAYAFQRFLPKLATMLLWILKINDYGESFRRYNKIILLEYINYFPMLRKNIMKIVIKILLYIKISIINKLFTNYDVKNLSFKMYG